MFTVMARGQHRLTQADYVAAAVKFVDDNDLESMTMRALGDALGVDATAVYRHFPSKEALLGAMVDWFLGEIVNQLPTDELNAREQLMEIALASRRTFKKHPELGRALVQAGPGGGTNAAGVTLYSIAGLRNLGLRDEDLVRCYQTLEGFVIGSCVYDFTGTPNNYAMRRQRYRAIEVPEFDSIATSNQSVEDLSEASFLFGLNALLDTFTALVKTVAR